MLLVFLLAFSASFLAAGVNNRNNVCRTFWDYKHIVLNKNCWHNPDVGSNPRDMVVRQGYPFQSYAVSTEDGFLLSLYRIPHNRVDPQKKRQPVFLQHGNGHSCEIWIDKGRRRSLAFQLVDHGFDVWLGNFRGSPHSLAHAFYPLNSKEFWNFSFHELGMFDVSAMLSFIGQVTNTTGQIIYIGHSMGTAAAFVYAVLKAEEAQKNLAGIVAMGPHAYFLPTTALNPFKAIFYSKNFLAFLDQHGLSYNQNIQKFFRSACRRWPINSFCQLILSIVVGFDSTQLLPEDIPLILSYLPVGISVKNAVHNTQQSQSGGYFQYFDYGNEGNTLAYGVPYPPRYDLKRISVPVHIICGRRDLITTEWAAFKIFEDLETAKSITVIEQFNHLDFVYAKNITELLYPSLFQIVQTLVV